MVGVSPRPFSAQAAAFFLLYIVVVVKQFLPVCIQRVWCFGNSYKQGLNAMLRGFTRHGSVNEEF